MKTLDMIKLKLTAKLNDKFCYYSEFNHSFNINIFCIGEQKYALNKINIDFQNM